MVRLCALLLLGACEGLDGPAKPGPDEEPGPVGTPGVTLVTPAEGQGFYGAPVEIRYEVTDFTLDAAGMDGANKPGRGHAHVYLDSELLGESTDGSFLINGLAEGTRTLEVRLAENDHTELDVTAERDFPVIIPVLAITGPADGTMLDKSNTSLTFSVADFDVMPARGEADFFGEGHVIVKVDGVFRDWSVDPMVPVEVTGLAAGPHTVQVELVSNTGLSLVPPIVKEITVTVPDLAPGVFFDRSVSAAPWDSATLPIHLGTANFTLMEPNGTGLPVPGAGYWHMFLDGAWLDGAASTDLVLEHVPPGEHLFEVVLAGNDLVELMVRDRMWVTIPADRPDVLVSYPGRDWVMGPSFEVTFAPENFVLDAAAMGGANSRHVGHAALWIDGALLAETAATTHGVTGLLPGAHTLRLELVNNDGTPLEPPVYTAFPFSVL
ncbi:MAG: hypothetical protein Q8P18_05015 [Pseudomonadota bacterium]|nr:hypothetical protein [Pseudomonadota bacterium]